ncbi:uncharacterized protein L201_001880 [Kwoniella dendrophila CBS 6074]|uniref:Prolyl endopeptidase n=1 Tax=Kwoniella dendrophila CBS 6074 TaxID=1295534 RepID=A0AAX4JR74_9TREE
MTSSSSILPTSTKEIEHPPHGAIHNQTNTSSFKISKDDWGSKSTSLIDEKYPEPPKDGGVTEEIFGITVKDPWRSLEEIDSESAQKFIQEQNKLSIPELLDHPLRADLERSVEQIYNHSKMDTPELQFDDYYYWNYNKGNWPRDILVRSKNLNKHFGKDPLSLVEKEKPEIFFDLNQLKDTSIYAHTFSPSGRLWSVVLQQSGSDWQSIRVIDTVTKEPVEKDVGGSKFTFGLTWIGDEGYIYKRAMNYGTQEGSFAVPDGKFGMFYHRIGQPQSTDIAVFPFTGEFDDYFVGKTYVVSSDLSLGSISRNWLTFDIYRNTNPETQLLVIELPTDLSKADGKYIKEAVKTKRKWITKAYTGETRYIGSLESDKHFFYSTADGYPTGRIISFEGNNWDNIKIDDRLPTEEFVPINEEGYQLHNAKVIGRKVIMLIYLKHACASIVFVNGLTGKKIGETDVEETKGEIELSKDINIPIPEEEFELSKTSKVIIPEHGSIQLKISNRFDSDEFYFQVDTWVAPSYTLKGELIKRSNDSTNLEVDISNINEISNSTLSNGLNENLVCFQTFYESIDGQKIPIFLCHPHDLDLTKPNPTLLHAYGGFCAPLTPHYDAFFASFMRNLRGIVAIAGIRGGGEYGKTWHDAAKGIKKSVSWDDFSYAAKYLQSLGLTKPELTAIYGSSNGGLMVTACTNRTPELFNTVFADVAITDLIRYHKFTLGRMWLGEYGSPEDPNEFPILLDTSPLHNIDQTKSNYPSILVTTADHDDRVVPSHSLKYLAELQSKFPLNQNQKQKQLILGKLYKDAGHESSSKNLQNKVEEVVDRLIFTLLTMKP